MKQIENEFQKRLDSFNGTTGQEMIKCAIDKGLQSGFFIESMEDLQELYDSNRDGFNELYRTLLKSFKPVNANGLSDRRVEMALRVSLENTLIGKDRMKLGETYPSMFLFSHEQLAQALIRLNPLTAQNPLAFLIDEENIHKYMSILKGKYMNQVGVSVRNGGDNYRESRYFISKQLIQQHLIDEVIKQAYHPTVWYLIISGNLLSYSHLFNKVKEYVQKSKAIS